ncbi:PREDICTED: B3 domain-containing protein Os04g0386900-like isoform X2 [Nelumbo nucifera]|uniref:B3 domain-containing protein Os04g0386900-like isoform X2 n=2 Tax=Nelumbo nucifera TaxID=4432 RepID=A0A1U8BIK3_NELNU|nr:PREDICTED: B3 domain-containing protein Os04g0386900-like isoform X2 [Nelumbo nucifera]DAD36591.1 TPA_asm: hypothetical protein HUJ06_007232 [Nelumbo nucifera]
MQSASTHCRQENEKGKTRKNLRSHVSRMEHQMDNLKAQPQLKPTSVRLQDNKISPLSGNPYFYCILTKSHFKPLYQVVLPSKLQQYLPSAMVPVELTFRNKSWKMYYYGDRGCKRFNMAWRHFVIDNKLKIGDGCVFELMESSPNILRFKVQVLNGDLPSDFISNIGESESSPIIID